MSVNDFLVEGGVLGITGIALSYDDRAVCFMPVFLYCPGVAGGVEITLQTGDRHHASGIPVHEDRTFQRLGFYSTGRVVPGRNTF